MRFLRRSIVRATAKGATVASCCIRRQPPSQFLASLPTVAADCYLATSSLCLAQPMRCYSTSDHGDDDMADLEKELKHTETRDFVTGESSKTLVERMAEEKGEDEVKLELEKMSRPPARFEVMTMTEVSRWQTTAKHGRKIVGPMREWADELKYRTGVHVEMDPTDVEKAQAGGYDSADEVPVNVYFFGTDTSIGQAEQLVNAMIKQTPAYVRLAVFRRKGSVVEWLALRRINKDLRPPDIPAISLKTPGKWTLLFESYTEAAIRTLWEETGIHVDESAVFPTAEFKQPPPQFYWRPPVRYFIAEIPPDTEVMGPQAATMSYMTGWDARLLRQSLDPVDRAWAMHADPKTGCAWLPSALIDELQMPLKGPNYMASRYDPPPESNLRDVVKLHVNP